MENYTNPSHSYNAAQAFNSVCAGNELDKIAMSNQVYVSPSNPGLPSDSFKRENTFTSSRFTQPVSEGKLFMKNLGSVFSGIGMVSKLVAFFFPPAAAVGTVAEIASPVLTTLAGDTTPKPVVVKTQEKYNPWLR